MSRISSTTHVHTYRCIFAALRLRLECFSYSLLRDRAVLDQNFADRAWIAALLNLQSLGDNCSRHYACFTMISPSLSGAGAGLALGMSDSACSFNFS